ncbi:Fe-S cluster assembly sulfur transfer protein SufU [Clostridium felsineum]|uniref:Zinc-dependent sulfurtransferase SufU n=1 Tax=Clostridium felsineum TaxID=36839 RepID=A0A1S8L2P2_9CLOT|nr:SUF system NifU family Fe-S cluster assembly protein [Clostridium felsineum]MCR3757662.1 SUF system NifU family Fe-S cluster assembly protein [Clostridium felsineum]URZ03266.1 Zinc-dependent sulfurtransferase SufU [Clostridium felsineum]URZ08400.1 Zinc-dependent sulfurtransferase SufU [Clostridium felsineum]URZ13431.1 Zinc-dependent sulfurtransferase SufU [Clostridium felsineum]
MDLNSLYTEIITEHNASSHNKHELQDATVVENGHNPSCGDEITLQLKIENNIVEDAAFVGVGCAISQASTSIMIDLIKGKTVEEAKKLVDTFIGMIKREITDEAELEQLEDALAFKNISNMPARVKCAVLAWHTFEECLNNKK